MMTRTVEKEGKVQEAGVLKGFMSQAGSVPIPTSVSVQTQTRDHESISHTDSVLKQYRSTLGDLFSRK